MILACVGIAVGYAAYQYNSVYEHVDIVEHPDSYVMPDYPELDDVPPEKTEPDVTEPSETEPSDTNTTENDPPVTEPSETEPSVTAPQETEPVVTEPVETLPLTGSGGSGGKLSVYKNVPIYAVKQKDPDVMNILLLGTDSRDVKVDRGRSDTMIVLSYNKKTGEAKMISLLRDGLVPIEGYGWNRINTAYIFGGVGLAINTVNQLFDLDIQRFVVIDMGGTEAFVDHIGGVDVKLTRAEVDFYNSNYGTSYTVGINHLSPSMTLTHMRNRSVDNDFGRTRRQRDVITAIIQTVLNQKSLTEILQLVEYGTSIVTTNIDMVTLTSLATSIVSSKSTFTIETANLPFSDSYKFAWYNKMAILSYDIAEAARRLSSFIYG